MIDTFFENALTEVQHFFAEPNAFRSVLLLILSLVAAYWLSHFLARGIIRIAQAVSTRSDNESNAERLLRLRQIETYLSVAVAAIRAITVAIVGYIAWRIISPTANASAAAIGAGAFFIVFAGGTLGLILRDITTGATMIAEQWYNIGDFIKVEPFMDASGVVERMTLRSTKLRSLSGEIFWVHNQHMMGVHVTPNGVRTFAIDVFVNNLEKGKQKIREITDVIPNGTTMLASPLKIVSSEKWGNELWRVSVVGQTMPGREWLVDTYFVNALKAIDDGKKKADKLMVYEPMVRYADPIAEKRFRRAVRIARDQK